MSTVCIPYNSNICIPFIRGVITIFPNIFTIIPQFNYILHTCIVYYEITPKFTIISNRRIIRNTAIAARIEIRHALIPCIDAVVQRVQFRRLINIINVIWIMQTGNTLQNSSNINGTGIIYTVQNNISSSKIKIYNFCRTSLAQFISYHFSRLPLFAIKGCPYFRIIIVYKNYLCICWKSLRQKDKCTLLIV